jgi:hypothetical protein
MGGASPPICSFWFRNRTNQPFQQTFGIVENTAPVRDHPPGSCIGRRHIRPRETGKCKFDLDRRLEPHAPAPDSAVLFVGPVNRNDVRLLPVDLSEPRMIAKRRRGLAEKEKINVGVRPRSAARMRAHQRHAQNVASCRRPITDRSQNRGDSVAFIGHLVILSPHARNPLTPLIN